MTARQADCPSVVVADDGEAVGYRDIPGYPGYRVGSDGVVWTSFKKIGLGPGRGSRRVVGGGWRRQNGSRGYAGYMTVVVHDATGRRKSVRVHTLVLLAFVGPRPPGHDACHGDGNPANNRLENLRWAPHRGNMQDMRRHGRSQAGGKNTRAKLTEDQVRDLLVRRHAGAGRAELAAAFGISKGQVTNIVTGRAWSHCHPDEVRHRPPTKGKAGVSFARLAQAQGILAAFAPHVAMRYDRGFRLSWAARTGETVERVWRPASPGSDYPTWHHAMPFGGTCSRAVSQLIRWVRGHPVLPLRVWEHWCGPTVGLNPEAFRRAEAAGWPVNVSCVKCGRVIKPTDRLDWYSHIPFNGPGCDPTCCRTGGE